MLDRKRFLDSGSYIKRGLSQQWDGIDNAGRGIHDSSAPTWKNLVSGGIDLPLKASGQWSDNALSCLGTGMSAQYEDGNLYFETLEITFRNRNPGTSYVIFSGGQNIGRYCGMTETATLWTGTYWTPGDGPRDFTSDNTEPVSLAWVSSGNAYASGTALAIENGIDYWGPGSDTIQVGGRDPTVNNSNPFTGDIYAIRTYYSTQLTAHEIAYNAKVDDARFFTPTGGQSFIWKGPEATLSDGVFGSNGCWKVADKKQSRAIPSIGDRVSLPAGDYIVTLDEATWALGSLSIGAGATLKLPLPTGAYDANKAILTLSDGIAVDDSAEIALDGVATFLANHTSWEIPLVTCGAGSTDTLRTLAATFNATLPAGRVHVTDGNSLVFKSSSPFTLIMR